MLRKSKPSAASATIAKPTHSGSEALTFPLKRLLPAVFFTLAVLLASSCSRSEPRIAYGTIELVYYQDVEMPAERFSFFVLPEDDDGIEDLAELRLYHDLEGLVWTLSPDDWLVFESEGKTWVGSRSIAMTGSDRLPRGQYRAVLIDKGGQQSSRRFSFDGPEESRHVFPILTITDRVYRIESTYPKHSFLCYDSQGSYTGTVAVPALIGDISDLDIPANTRAVSLWAEDPDYFTSAVTDAVPIN